VTRREERDLRIPIHRRIADTLGEAIERGDYPPGSRLPSEAALVRDLGVSRGTLRHALLALRSRGLIEAVPARGTFVRSGSPARGDARRRVVGVVVPSVATPYVPDLLVGVEDELHSRGYSMLVGSTGATRTQQAGRVRRIVDEGVAGLIAYPIDYEPDAALFGQLAANGLPIVLVDRHIIGQSFDAVLADNVGGAFAAVTHLVEQGHTRIAFVSTDNVGTTSVLERLQGYQHALAVAGIEPSSSLAFTSLPVSPSRERDYRVASPDNASRIATFLARSDATAVFALHDHLALEVIEAARMIGRQVPDDLAVVGFDDDPLAGELPIPLTTMAQPRERIGRVAAGLVVDRIEGSRAEIARIVLPVTLVVRRSSVATDRVAAQSA
jgi:GntR family transcriptional regulator, arabinose operon transcriptional repressor